MQPPAPAYTHPEQLCAQDAGEEYATHLHLRTQHAPFDCLESNSPSPRNAPPSRSGTQLRFEGYFNRPEPLFFRVGSFSFRCYRDLQTKKLSCCLWSNGLPKLVDFGACGDMRALGMGGRGKS